MSSPPKKRFDTDIWTGPLAASDVAVVGAGPAGARLAWRLASSGARVSLFDHRFPWEKPCGGGLNPRAAALLAESLPERSGMSSVNRARLVCPAGKTLSVDLPLPFAVVSRRALQRAMVDAAVTAGAVLVRERVAGVALDEGHRRWTVHTAEGGRHAARFVAGADGAGSRVRRALTGARKPGDLHMAFGLVWNAGIDTGTPAGLELRFSEDPPGYIWEFPGEGFVTLGFSLPFGAAHARRAFDVLRRHLAAAPWRSALAKENAHPDFRGAPAPAPAARYWSHAPIQGKGWALVGDAAGLADPLTGEGIHHALHSADLLAAALIEGRAERYASDILDGPARELARAAEFTPGFFSRGFTSRMIALASRHDGVRDVLVELLSGSQGYLGLKRRLLRKGLPAALAYFAGRWTGTPAAG